MSRALNDFLDLDSDPQIPDPIRQTPFDAAGDAKSAIGLNPPEQAASAPVSELPEMLSQPATCNLLPVTSRDLAPALADATSRAAADAIILPARPASGALQISSAANHDREARATEADWRAAETEAALFRQFHQLTLEGYSQRSAAKLVGRAPSQFSGEQSRYQRFLREGPAALLPEPREATANLGDLSAQIEALGWFIPAAKFFNLKANSAADRGSVPEAIRRAISLPALPTGWTDGLKKQLIAAIKRSMFDVQSSTFDVPVCPPDLRAAILARERAGQPLVPDRIARQIVLPKSVVKFARNERDWSLNNLSAPGSARRFNARFPSSEGSGVGASARSRMQAGDWFGGDDATPGIAVCVPCNEVMTPCSQKFNVLLGRFQWLAFVDCAYDVALGFDYVVRPRGSYRAEDILHGMKTIVRTHGIPHQGWQFEGGTFNSHAVRNAIKAMACQHWRTYSPHQKVVEILFNKAWTRLALHFPHADMGRFRGENAENCALYEACKAGHKDPRRYFPKLAEVVAVFSEVLAEHNRTPIKSRNYGSWIPEEIWTDQTTARPLRQISAGGDWMFAPFSFERTVKGMMVGGKVPMFEDFSVPFDFTRADLHLYDGAKVRCHFDPREPHCSAMLVLLENCAGRKAGELIGPARLVNETAGYLRMAMDWAEDDAQAGRVARQQTAGWMRRLSRGLGAGGKIHYATDEQRDGLGKVTKVEQGGASVPASHPAPSPVTRHPAPDAITARRAEADDLLQEFERENKHLLV